MIPGKPDYIFFLVICIAFIIIRIPWIGKFFRVIDTLFHESGHALMALFTSGNVLKIELFNDTSGTAFTQSGNKFSEFLISLSGYPFASAMSFVFFYLIRQGNFIWVLLILSIFILINLALWVRNKYGIFWLLAFGSILWLIYYLKNDMITYCFILCVSSILLFDSIIKCFQLVYISFTSPKSAGDAANLKKQTYIPAFIWAFLFLVISMYFTYQIFLLFFTYDFLSFS